MANEYVTSLSENPFFAKRTVHAVVLDALTKLLSGSVAVGFAALLIWRTRVERREREQDMERYLSLKEMDRRIARVRDAKMRSILITGALTLVAYRPTNAALLKYLHKKGVIEDDFVDIVRNLRPYRIKTLGL